LTICREKSNFSGEIKLCDFGESRVLDNSLASSDVGTSVYWPPERFTKGLYDIRSEIWSLGITLIELILGKLPYTINEVISLHAIISSTNFEEIICIKMKPFYSEVLCDLLKQCTNKVEERPKLEDLMLSRFYKECNDLSQDQIAQFFSLVKEVPSSNDKVL
jgi:serine/threonine protein kinase